MIHTLGRQTFKHCRRKYYLSYVLGLTSASRGSVPMTVGQIVHAGLAGYYGALMDGRQTPRSAKPKGWKALAAETDRLTTGMDSERVDEVLALRATCYNHYTDWAATHDPWERILGVEVPMIHHVRLARSVRVALVGTADLVVLLQGQVYIVDHKTVAQWYTTEMLNLDDQMAAYMYLAPMTFKAPNGVGGAIYTMIRRKVPAGVGLLKRGGLSTTKNMDTTPEVYLAAIRRYKLDPEEYSDHLQLLASREWIRREVIPYEAPRVDQFRHHLKEEFGDIVRCHDSGEWYPAPQFDCARMCQFGPLCGMMNQGLDLDTAIQGLYVPREEDTRSGILAKGAYLRGTWNRQNNAGYQCRRG